MLRGWKRLVKDTIPTPLPRTGTPPTRPGGPRPYPAWPGALPGLGHPQPPWATCSSACFNCEIYKNVNTGIFTVKSWNLVKGAVLPPASQLPTRQPREVPADGGSPQTGFLGPNEKFRALPEGRAWLAASGLAPEG